MQRINQSPAGPHRDVRLQTPQLVDVSADLTRYLLQRNPERLHHSQAVAERAMLITAAVADDEAPLLVAAAWLHDIGYTDSLRRTDFHPLDGGLHLRQLGWPDAVCNLVAHHSGARFVAKIRGFDEPLGRFDYDETPLSDALTVADQTAGPDGTPMTVHERIADMLTRHGPNSPNAKAHAERGPHLLAAARRVADRLVRAGITAEQHRIF